LKDNREAIKKAHPTFKVTEVAKEGGKQWKALGATAKKKYEDLAAKDKARFEKEKVANPPAPRKSKKASTKKAKKEKDTNAPKRGATAYFLWLADNREAIKKGHPEFKVTDVAREGGVRWRALKDKKKYEDLAAKDKQRYEKEMAAYNKSK
jgi:hypothetical protein